MLMKNMECETLIYPEGCWTIPYINTVNGEVTILDEDEHVDDFLMRVPSREELVPYNKAMWNFINEHHIVIPKGISASRFLAEKGQKCEFYSYWDEMAFSELKNWIETIQPNC